MVRSCAAVARRHQNDGVAKCFTCSHCMASRRCAFSCSGCGADWGKQPAAHCNYADAPPASPQEKQERPLHHPAGCIGWEILILTGLYWLVSRSKTGLVFPGISPLWYYRLASNSPFWKYTLQGSISVMLMLTISKALWNSQIGLSDPQPSKTLSKAWRHAAAKGRTNDSVQLQALFSLPLLTCSLLCVTHFQIFQSSAQSLAPPSLFLLSILWGSGLLESFLPVWWIACSLSLCKETWTYLQRGGCNWWLCTASPPLWDKVTYENDKYDKAEENSSSCGIFIAEIKTKFMTADKIASRKAAEAKLHLVLPPALLGAVL